DVQLSPSVNVTGRIGGDEWVLPHGTNGPLTGEIVVSDADGDPVRFVLLDQAAHGTLTLSQNPANSLEYSFEYDPPTIRFYDPSTGSIGRSTAITGNDQFTLEASDGIAVTDVTVRFDVTDLPPVSPDVASLSPTTNRNTDFVVPENTGLRYYTEA